MPTQNTFPRMCWGQGSPLNYMDALPVQLEYSGADGGAYPGSAASKGNRRRKQPSCITFNRGTRAALCSPVILFPHTSSRSVILSVERLNEKYFLGFVAERAFTFWLALATNIANSVKQVVHRSDQKFNLQPPHFPQKSEADNFERLDTWSHI